MQVQGPPAPGGYCNAVRVQPGVKQEKLKRSRAQIRQADALAAQRPLFRKLEGEEEEPRCIRAAQHKQGGRQVEWRRRKTWSRPCTLPRRCPSLGFHHGEGRTAIEVANGGSAIRSLTVCVCVRVCVCVCVCVCAWWMHGQYGFVTPPVVVS